MSSNTVGFDRGVYSAIELGATDQFFSFVFHVSSQKRNAGSSNPVGVQSARNNQNQIVAAKTWQLALRYADNYIVRKN
jgi:hypothetical protein